MAAVHCGPGCQSAYSFDSSSVSISVVVDVCESAKNGGKGRWNSEWVEVVKRQEVGTLSGMLQSAAQW